MEVISSIKLIKETCGSLRSRPVTVGFVPTMGFLHKGHLSLIEMAKKDCKKIIISIFVNPLQFGKNEDYDNYPRDIDRDYRLAKKSGVDYIFIPSAEEIYKKDHKTFVEVIDLSNIMCGKYRPQHFRGVCTVVLKLINIVNPDKAYFGQKDYQQLVIIKKMLEDLNRDVEVISCPTVREKDGLALSSRNKYLPGPKRKKAAILYKSLNDAAASIKTGREDLGEIKKTAIENIKKSDAVSTVDYFDFRNPVTLEEILNPRAYLKESPDRKILIAAAIRIGKTRLIDNILI